MKINQNNHYFIRTANGVPILGSMVLRKRRPTGGHWVQVEASALGLCCAFNDILQSPSNFAIVAGSPTASALNLSWTASPSATAYTLERSTTAAFTTSTIVYTGAGTSYNNSGLTASTTYYYRISATGPTLHKSAFAYASKATTA